MNLLILTLQLEDWTLDYEKKINQTNGSILVMWYTPWCKHYQTWKEQYELLGLPKTKIVQVNCVQRRDLCQIERIKEYPSFKLYNNGQLVATYHGERKLKDIQQWVQNKIR